MAEKIVHITDDTFENEATASVFVVAPTLTADEMHPGTLIALVAPALPAAMTVAMPANLRLSMIGLCGCESQFVVDVAPPRLRFTEAKLRVPRSA